MSTRALVALWNLAILLTAGAVYLVLASDREANPWLTVALSVPVGLAFVGAGLVALSQRPENRTGLLMTLVGFTWLGTSLSDANGSLVHTVGAAFEALPFVFFAWLVLAYPSGRLQSGFDAVVVGLTALIALVIAPARYLVAEQPDLCEDCPPSAFLVSEQPEVADALDALFGGLAFAVTLAIVVALARRWRSATPALRRALTPVFLAVFVVAGALAAGVVLESTSGLGPEAIDAIGFSGLLAVPVAFLLGLLRSRLARAEVGRIVVELGQARESQQLREVLARGLRDPTLEVAYRLDDDTWIDGDGILVDLPDEGSGRTATFVDHEGRHVAALLHDSSLLDDRELLDACTAAASLSLQNQQRLHALAASEGRTRALLDAIPDLMFRIAPDGTYLEFKVEDHRDLATAPDEVVGRTVRERLPEEVADKIMDGIERALAGEGAQTVEYALTIGGRRRQYEGRIAASAEDEALLIVREITERKEAEAALRAERDLIRTVVDTATGFFCGVDPDGRIVRFNRRLEELSGLADDDSVRGQPFRDVFVAPGDADEWERRFRESVAAGGGEEYENRWRIADGGEAIVAWSANWYPGENGADRYLISGSDVTERHRHAVELQQQHDFLNAIANSAPSLLTLVDERGVVAEAASNVAFERLLGYDGGEIGGEIFWERYVDPAEADDVRERMQRVFAGEQLGEQDNHWVTSSGERLLMAWTCTALPQIDERTLFLVTGVDVTVRKRQEEELRASRARILEAGVSERRRLERNLHDGAQQRLVALSLALRLATAKLHKDPAAAEKLLVNAAEELAHALEELRELARGIHPAVLTDRGLAPALEALAARSPVEVQVETPPLQLPPPVEAAAYYVVSEALANVVKYAKAKSVWVRVEQRDGRVIVGVKDDGVGGADPARGTGLRGLADRVAALDGRFEVLSRPGEGTAVRAEIPFHEPALTE